MTDDDRPSVCCGVCPPIAGGGYDCTCEGNPRCTVTATDNARAEAWDKGWHAGYTDRHLEHVNHRGNMIRREQTPNPYRAAGRAETTTNREEPHG